MAPLGIIKRGSFECHDGLSMFSQLLGSSQVMYAHPQRFLTIDYVYSGD